MAKALILSSDPFSFGRIEYILEHTVATDTAMRNQETSDMITANKFMYGTLIFSTT